MVLSLFSCEKNDENSKIQNSSEEGDLYLRALEFPDEESYINIKRNDSYYPVKLYFSNSLENDLINSEDIISETEYSEDVKVKSYKQQKSDLEDPLLYIYENDKVELTHLGGGSYYSCDLPFIGEGPASVHDFNKELSYIVSSSNEDTLFYEIKNGNVIKISTVEHVLYEYTYDEKPYFGAGILYDFYSTEFDFQWWFIPEFIPKNNITSIKKYIYAGAGTFSPDEDEVQVYNFKYEYNESGYPTQMETQGFLWMKFYYQSK